MRQRIQFTRAADGARLAWTQLGSGPVLVKASTWLTHLQYDWDSPVWRHWMEFLARHFCFIRYDERGSGMSDWEVGDLSDANWAPDLECIIGAAQIDRPMILLGISQGSATAIRYAVQHPERVSHLILYGGYTQGPAVRGGGHERHYRAVVDMISLGWGSDNPVFRQAFTGLFIPGASHEQIDWFNELCSKTASPENAVRLLEARGHFDVTGLLGKVRVPTLVMHARQDEIVPFSEGRRLAAEIPGSTFVELESRNHILLADEPAWAEFKRNMLEFVGVRPADETQPDLGSLTRRQREILGMLTQGLSNAEIGRRLFISEKTVRNHLSVIYRKLDVVSRTQAMARLREQIPG